MSRSTAPRVLFVGDVNVDLIFGGLKQPLQEDREVQADSFCRTMGSSAVIAAVALRCLGGQADVCGLVGNDENGTYMLRELDDLGIGRTLIAVDTETPTGVTVNLIYGGMRSQVTYAGTIAKFKGPELAAHLGEYAHAHFSGIYQQTAFLPNILPTLSYLKDLGVSLSLDTQWDATEGWGNLDAILPFLDHLFVNRDEALSITGEESVELAVAYLGERVPYALVKIGREGVWVSAAGSTTLLPACPADVVDTTGAGDAFAAGFLYGLYVGNMTAVDAARYGSAVAARNCEFSGGVGARSTDSDIQRKLKEAKIA